MTRRKNVICPDSDCNCYETSYEKYLFWKGTQNCFITLAAEQDNTEHSGFSLEK